MSTDTRTKFTDIMQHSAYGPGLVIRMRWLGCWQPKPQAGSRGVGLARRCAVCVETKALAKAVMAAWR